MTAPGGAIGSGIQSALAAVASEFAARQPSGRAGAGLGITPAGRVGQGVLDARAKAWQQAQREYQAAAERARAAIQAAANREAVNRLRKQRNVTLLGLPGPTLDLDPPPGALPWDRTTPRKPGDPGFIGPVVEREPWEDQIQPRPGWMDSFIDQTTTTTPGSGGAINPLGGPVGSVLNRLTPSPKPGEPGFIGPVSGDRPTDPKVLAAHRAGERAPLLPQAQLDRIVAPEFDKAMGWQGAYNVYSALREIDDPGVYKYFDYLDQYNEDMRNGKLGVDPEAPGSDGDFGTTSSGNPWSIPSVGSSVFPYVLVRDPGTGKFSLTNVKAYYNNLNQEALTNPERAGELMLTLSALGAYGGGTEKFVEDRVQVVRDAKTGKAKVLGMWSIDDAAKLHAYLPQLAALQAQQAQNGRIEGLEQLMAEEALKRQNLVTTKGTGPATGDGYGRGGGRRYYGGGGGGFGGGSSSPTRLTDPAVLGATVDSIARQRMGRVLTTDEKAAFIAQFHALERASSAGYQSGGEFTPPDIEGQAVAWIESRYVDESAAQSYGNFFQSFAQFANNGLMGS